MTPSVSVTTHNRRVSGQEPYHAERTDSRVTTGRYSLKGEFIRKSTVDGLL
jgi:hypothetical protein